MEYVCTSDGRKFPSVLTGLVRLGGKLSTTKPVGPGFDGSEPATRWKGINWVMGRMEYIVYMRMYLLKRRC